jgi:hypothetical protein
MAETPDIEVVVESPKDDPKTVDLSVAVPVTPNFAFIVNVEVDKEEVGSGTIGLKVSF